MLFKLHYLSLSVWFFSVSSLANWSSTISVTSDYLFNGITQTQHDAAIQASLDWANSSGWYVGSWASNVDFQDSSDAEIDLYLGKNIELDAKLALDIGIASYQYAGDGVSHQGDYQEAYIGFNMASKQLKFWFSPDYFGSGAKHIIVKYQQQFTFTDNTQLNLMIDYSKSLDKQKYTWQQNDVDYWHYAVYLNHAWHKFDWSLSLQSTDLQQIGETRLVFSVSKTLNW